MDKKKVIIACEKWLHPLDFACTRITGADHALAGSLISSELAEVNVCYWDDYFRTTGQQAVNYIIDYCRNDKPDALVISCLIRDIFNVEEVVKNVQVPIVYIWWDHLSPHNRNFAESLSPWVALHVVMDGTNNFHTNYPEKYMQGWNTHDTRLFYDPQQERDINVTFQGSTHPPFNDRIFFLDFLDRSGINVVRHNGLNGDDLVLIDEYAKTYQRSKIALSFTLAPYLNGHQMKGRTFEITRCGAMLLESRNGHTSKHFIPFEEYVPFDDEHDLLQKIRYYLANDAERQRIAAAGCKKVTEKYGNLAFWGEIFRRI